MKTVFALLAVLAAGAPCPAAFYFADRLDEDEGWVTDPIHWGPGFGDLRPSAGQDIWGSTYDRRFTISLEIIWDGLEVEAGMYELSVDVSAPATARFYQAIPLDTFTYWGLLGISAPRETISAETPPIDVEEWTTWTVRYVVPAGSPDIGNTLGFRSLATVDDYTIMMDNLVIDFTPVPEPSTLGLLAIGALAAAPHVARWRRARCAIPVSQP